MTRPLLASLFLTLAVSGQVIPDWAQVIPPSLSGPPPLTGHVMVTDGFGVILFGGNGGGTYFNQTWQFDGTTWLQIPSPSSPSARRRHGGAYDLTRGRFVVFGGQDNSGGVVGDTWEFDGANWTQATPATSPSARRDHSMAYDVQNGVTLLFSGRDGAGVLLSDMWAWDGATWTQLAPAVMPPARWDGQMTWDSTNGQAVLFGGRGAGPLSDTWIWSGGSWSQVTPPRSPSARYTHAMTYDTVRQRVVVFGGHDGSRYIRETWEYDGVTWAQRGASPYPHRRGGPQIVHVPVSGRTYLYGGWYASAYSDTWELRANRVWQGNSPSASLDLDGMPSSPFAGPSRLRILGGQSGAANLDSVLPGAAGWDIGFAASPAVPHTGGGTLIPGGQLVNLDLASFQFMNSGAFASPWPGGAVTLPFTGGGPLVATGQLVVLDPSQQLGFVLSGAAELTVADCAYLENLDAVPVTPPYTYPSGWTTSPGTTGWIVWNGSTPTANTGPAADHTSGHGNYAYCESSAPWSTATFTLDLGPQVIASLSSPTLDFWCHMHGGNVGTLEVEFFDGIVWTSIWSLAGDQGMLWQNVRIPLNATGPTVQLRFRYQGIAESGDVAIDDVALCN